MLIDRHPIAEIKPLELSEALRKVEKREKLHKARQRYGKIFRYAIITGRAEYNPAFDLASALTPSEKQHFLYSLNSHQFSH